MSKLKNQKSANRKAVAYSRVATAMQKNPDSSIQTQQRSIKALAKNQGLEVVKCFVSISGRTPTTAHRLQEILNYCKTNQIEALLVNRPDRISRSLSDYQEWERKFKKVGVLILSLADDAVAEQQWLDDEVEDLYQKHKLQMRLAAVRRKWGVKNARQRSTNHTR